MIKEDNDEITVEEATEKNGNPYIAVFESNPDSVSISTLEGIFVNINNSFAKELGFTKKEVVGKSVYELNIWFDTKKRDKWIQLLKKQKRVNNFETKFRTKKGNIIIGLLSAVIINFNGKPHIIAISKNITKMKESEQEMIESQERYMTLFKRSPDAVAISRLDSGYVDVNNAYSKITGYERKELIGKLSSDIKIWVNPKDREKLIKELKIKGFVENLESEFRCKDGTIKTGLLSANIIKIKGIPHILTITRDISDMKLATKLLKESEIKYKTLIENSPDIIYTHDLKGNFISWNKQAEKILGYTYEEGIKMNISDILTPDSLKKAVEMINFKRISLKNTHPYELSLISKTGKIISVEINSAPIIKNGKVIAVQGSARDISERKKNREMLIKNLEQQKLLADISLLFSKTENFEQNVNTALSLIGKHLSVSRVYIFEDYDDGKYTKNTYEWCNIGITSQKENLQEVPYKIIPSWKKILADKGMICSENILNLPRDLVDILKPQDIKAILILPLYVNEKFYGFMGFDECKTNRAWTDSDVNLLITVTNFMSELFERKIAQLKLRKSEEKFRSIYENSAIGIYRTTIEGEILLLNPAVVKMLGFSSFDELKNYSPTTDKFLSKSERIKFIKAIKKHGVINNFESKWIRKDGSTIDVRETAKIIFDEAGKIKYFDGTVEDITEQKKAEKELLKLSAAVRQSPATVVITDLGGNIEYANPKFMEITGYAPNEFIGKNPRILKSGEHSSEFYKTLWNTITSGKVWKNEFHNKRKDGSLFWESATIAPIFDKKGKIINYLKIAEDITEKKRIELIQLISFDIAKAINRTKNLVELLQFIKEEIGKLIDTSNYFVALYDKKTDTISLPFDIDEKDNFEKFPAGKTFTSYVIKTDRALFAPIDIQNKLVKEGKVTIIGTQPKIWIGIPLKIDNNVIGVLAIQNYYNENAYSEKDVEFLTFVSEEIAFAIKQKEADDRIKQDLKEKNALVKELYHRTKNNMQVITSMIKMSSRNIDNPIVHEMVKKITSKINTMALVHKKLYEEKDLSQINLKEYIKDVIDLLSNTYRVKKDKILITYHLADISVLIDTALPLGLILNEFISNALKHAFPGEMTGEIIIRLYKDENDEINIFIEDNGVGLPPDMDLEKAMGIQDAIFLTNYQLGGKIKYDKDSGMKWHIKFRDNLHERRI